MAPLFSFQLQEPAEGGKPWVVLIHGLGMSHRSWSDPFKESLLGGGLSFDYVLTDLQAPPDLCHFPAVGRFGCSPPLRLSNPRPLSFWESLKREGCGIACWSQEKPLGPIDHAVGELQNLLMEIPQRKKIVLLGHSRGGLVARKYLQDRRPGWDRISGVSLLGVPNHGSRLAKLGPFLARSLSFFGVKDGRHCRSPHNGTNGAKSFQIRNLVAYGREGGTAELVPGSAFLRSLAAGEAKEKENKIPYCNIVGTRADFIRIYLRFSPSGRARPVISLFDGLERIIPPLFLPLEIRQGRGDGQVSANSARLSWAGKNQFLPMNHAQFLVSAEVQTIFQNFLKAI